MDPGRHMTSLCNMADNREDRLHKINLLEKGTRVSFRGDFGWRNLTKLVTACPKQRVRYLGLWLNCLFGLYIHDIPVA